MLEGSHNSASAANYSQFSHEMATLSSPVRSATSAEKQLRITFMRKGWKWSCSRLPRVQTIPEECCCTTEKWAVLLLCWRTTMEHLKERRRHRHLLVSSDVCIKTKPNHVHLNRSTSSPQYFMPPNVLFISSLQ